MTRWLAQARWRRQLQLQVPSDLHVVQSNATKEEKNGLNDKAGLSKLDAPKTSMLHTINVASCNHVAFAAMIRQKKLAGSILEGDSGHSIGY